jgi:hypothetical protein
MQENFLGFRILFCNIHCWRALASSMSGAKTKVSPARTTSRRIGQIPVGQSVSGFTSRMFKFIPNSRTNSAYLAMQVCVGSLTRMPAKPSAVIATRRPLPEVQRKALITAIALSQYSPQR